MVYMRCMTGWRTRQAVANGCVGWSRKGGRFVSPADARVSRDPGRSAGFMGAYRAKQGNDQTNREGAAYIITKMKHTLLPRRSPRINQPWSTRLPLLPTIFEIITSQLW